MFPISYAYTVFLCLSLASAFPSTDSNGLFTRAHGNKVSTSGANNASQACAEASILAGGIALNIADQKQEQAALAQVKAALATNPVNSAAFSTAKQNLLTFVKAGIFIREMNQKIAPAGNAAIPGLAIVANAQLTELGLASNLTGNPAVDNPNVASLEADFAGGIQQNQKNQAAAMQGCPC